MVLGTAAVCAPGHSISGGLRPGLDAGGGKSQAWDGGQGCAAGLGPGLWELGPEADSPRVRPMA